MCGVFNIEREYWKWYERAEQERRKKKKKYSYGRWKSIKLYRFHIPMAYANSLLAIFAL